MLFSPRTSPGLYSGPQAVIWRRCHSSASPSFSGRPWHALLESFRPFPPQGLSLDCCALHGMLTAQMSGLFFNVQYTPPPPFAFLSLLSCALSTYYIRISCLMDLWSCKHTHTHTRLPEGSFLTISQNPKQYLAPTSCSTSPFLDVLTEKVKAFEPLK